jgi:ABC-type nitrate/sulfonate/bicarbonate transport system substrate-binding protein
MYSDYRFGPKDQVLDIGIQPLWVPTSTITEAMKRDQVLGREMAKLGMRARFHPFRLGPEGNAFLGDDRLDGMLAGDMPALTAAADKDVVIVTLVHQGFGAIVAKGVKSVAGLRGKKVAYAPGSSTHFTLLRVLQLHGIRPEEVTLAPMVDLANQAEKLRTGEVAAISVWDPLTSALTKTVPGSVILHRSLFEGYMYFTRQAVERHP